MGCYLAMTDVLPTLHDFALTQRPPPPHPTHPARSSPPAMATASRCPTSWPPSCGGGGATRAPAAAAAGRLSSGSWSGWGHPVRGLWGKSTWRLTTCGWVAEGEGAARWWGGAAGYGSDIEVGDRPGTSARLAAQNQPAGPGPPRTIACTAVHAASLMQHAACLPRAPAGGLVQLLHQRALLGAGAGRQVCLRLVRAHEVRKRAGGQEGGLAGCWTWWYMWACLSSCML